MASRWGRKRILITVRTYPSPAKKSIEASCTAGITEEGAWIRLFPVPYRLMAEENRFSKWQWINTDIVKATSDTRPESYKLNSESIIAGEKVGTSDGWRTRRDFIRPLVRPSLCHIKREQEQHGAPTLGVFKPAQIKRLILEPDDPAWSAEQFAILNQGDLFRSAPTQTLEKIPFKFIYDLQCTDRNCTGHKMSCTDWEMAQAYRRWHREYGEEWEKYFRQRFEQNLIEKWDTHFFVGTVHQHPTSWIIVGLFYPPKETMGDLFD